MTFKTSAENGSSAAGRRESSCSVRGSIPWMGGTSSGLGRKSMTASSSGWTALFLKAEPGGRGAEGALEHIRRDRGLVLEVRLHQFVVMVGDRVDQLVVVLVRLFEQLGRD